MKLLTKNQQQESYENAQIWCICKEKFENKYLKDKYNKVRDHSHYTEKYRGAAHSIYNLKYSVPKKFPIAFHNGSNHDYHFLIKESPEEFKKQLTCLGQNTATHIAFAVPIEEKNARINKNGE